MKQETFTLFRNELTKYLLLESNNTLTEDTAKAISYDVVSGLDLKDPYVLHSSIRQRAKDILPKIKKEYLVTE